MLKTIIQRLLQGVVVVFLLYTITFFLVKQLPGKPYIQEKSASPEIQLELDKKHHLDKPLITQYFIRTSDKLKGDFNISTSLKRPVLEIIGQSFPVSVLLGITATIMAICMGIPAGVIAALKKNSLIDYGTMTIAMAGISIPSFVAAPLIAGQIGARIPGLKVAGWGDPLDWLLPAFCLGLGTAAYLARISRSGMSEVLNQDYIRTARAKGLSERKVVIKHALKGGILPAVAYIGPAFAALITGSFIIETIFQVPGMGQHFVTAIGKRDHYLIEGLVILFGSLIVLVNLAADIAMVLINPRLRSSK